MGGGRPLWVLGVVRGAGSLSVGGGSLSVGGGSLFVGAGLSSVGAGARSRERVVHVAAGFSVWARWCRVVCWVWSPLARWDGMKVVLLTEQQRRTTTSSSFIIWLPRHSRRRGTCKRLQPSPSIVTWHSSYLLWWLWAWATGASGGHWRW